MQEEVTAMKISFSTLGCPRWSWQEITATAYDLGYQGIEVRGVGKDISVPSIPAFSDENIVKTKAELTRLELSIPCLDSDCCIHLRENEQATNAEIEAYVRLAQKLNAPYVRIMATAPVPQPVGTVDAGYVRARAVELGHFAMAHGIKLLIETHGIWSDSEKLARLMSTLGCEGVGVLWDVHHPYRFMGEKPETTFQNLQPWLCHTHFKDSSALGDGYRYSLPGFGNLPLEETVGVLKAGGYKGFYSLEWVKRWDMTLEEPGIVFAHYANYMKTL
ncbi:MAG: sugar phosphate isomerase/epimerase family protein [Clostridia bacterium]